MSRLLIAAALLAGAAAACGPSDAASADGRTVWKSLPVVPDALESIADFALLDERGRRHQLSRYSRHPLVAMLVQGNECPIVRNTLSTWRELKEEFEPRGVAFLMLNANLQDDRESIAEEAREFDIDTPILLDDAQLVSGALGIGRTAEVLVFTPGDLKLVYRGPVDDRLGYESQRSRETHRYLHDALTALLDGRPVIAATEPVRGCLITSAISKGSLADAPSYARDIAPILQQRCGVCHREDGIGPWSLDGYETVRGWSAMIREVVLTRRMPPWHADPTIGHFINDRSLDPEQARALLAWIDAGAPRGDGPDPLAEAAGADPPPKWALGEPDLVLTLEEQQLPATGLIDYRYVTLDIPLEEDVWIVAAELRPSNPKVLHHSLAILEGPGLWTKNWPEATVAAYAPGRRPVRFPEGTGIPIRVGSSFRMQLHYTSTGKPEVDQPQVALYFADEPPERQLLVKVGANHNFVIPPGASNHVVRRSVKFDRDALIYSFRPHMHYRGKSMTYEARYPDGSKEVLLSVPDYRFNWQTHYALAEPKRVPAGTIIKIIAVYDNSDLNPDNPDPTVEVRWGLQSVDEMFLAYTHYAYVDE